MTQVGGGQEAAGAVSPVTTYSAPEAGEVLADRYQLAEHINDDNVGRQIWRGIDVILRRPVAVVLRYPGGNSATEMLQAAVTASRVVHPNLAGVYDAIDEGNRAYVVREWIEGASLREVVAAGPLDAERATTIAHAVGAAVAAVHATGMAHGNVHPGTVLIDHDGRVVLADARDDGTASVEGDIRAVGGVLYFALTGHWPHAEAGQTALPDAVRDSTGALASPRQSRAGVPDYLDELTVTLLDPQVQPPTADVLAAELGRLDVPVDDHFLDDSGPLRFSAAPEREYPVRRNGRKIAVGMTALVAISLVAMLILVPLLNGGGDGQAASGGKEPTATGSGSPGSPDGGGGTGSNSQQLPIAADKVRIVDPEGDRTELRDAELVVDGDLETGWKTHHYQRRSNFGGIKPGMGVLIDLGSPRQIDGVKVDLSAPGYSAEMRTGDSDPGATKAGDRKVLETYTIVGESVKKATGATTAFGGFNPDQTYQYLLLWITDLPRDETGEYQIGVQEIVVNGS